MDVRQRVLLDCDAGPTNQQAADEYCVSTARVRRLKQHGNAVVIAYL